MRQASFPGSTPRQWKMYAFSLTIFIVAPGAGKVNTASAPTGKVDKFQQYSLKKDNFVWKNFRYTETTERNLYIKKEELV
jgi:hypothetical protein